MNTPNQQVPHDDKPFCCFIDADGKPCLQPPKFEVFSPPFTYDDYTHACPDHVEDLKSRDDDVVRPL